MRKLICFVIAVVLCLTIAVPAFATEGDFVPSITYKPNPEIVPVENEDGEEAIGMIRNADGEIVSYVDPDCLQITPVAHIWDEEEEIPEDVKTLLTFVYEGLNSHEMELPYEKLEGADLDSANMVIRDLFDARWTCQEHKEMVEKEGVVFEITFDLGVVADAQIFAMTYDEASKEWSPVVKTVNNGDGTVTCTFEHLCAVAFSMPIATNAPIDDDPGMKIWPWIIALLIALVAIVIIVFIVKKKKAE